MRGIKDNCKERWAIGSGFAPTLPRPCPDKIFDFVGARRSDGARERCFYKKRRELSVVRDDAVVRETGLEPACPCEH